MMRRITVATTAFAVLAAGAPAAEAGKLRSQYRGLYEKVADAHGKRAAGRNIVEDGVRTNNNSVRTASAADLRRSIGVFQNTLAPPAPSSTSTGGSNSGFKSAASSTGSSSGGCGAGYRGLFQFDCQTWRSVGCSGDPAAASPSYQRQCAERLRGQRGNQPWPRCGRGGASLDEIMRCESGGDPGAVG